MATSFYALPLLLLLFLLPLCHGASYIGQFCDGGSTDSQLKINIRRVLADLEKRAPSDGFADSSHGSGNKTVYGLAQCRGDVSAKDCASCVADAVRRLPRGCSVSASESGIWYDYCFVRYKDEKFFGKVDTRHTVVIANMTSEEDLTRFDDEVGKLMARVRAEAAAAGSRGLGRGRAQYSPDVTIYGLAQCTRDLAALPCEQCLAEARSSFLDYCQYRKGCQVYYGSCMARYEEYPFFFPLATRKASLPAAQWGA